MMGSSDDDLSNRKAKIYGESPVRTPRTLAKGYPGPIVEATAPQPMCAGGMRGVSHQSFAINKSLPTAAR